MPEQGGHPSTNTEDGMAEEQSIDLFAIGGEALTREEALELSKRLDRFLLERSLRRVSQPLVEIEIPEEVTVLVKNVDHHTARVLMRAIAKSLGILLLEFRSIADHPLSEAKDFDRVLVWNPCDGPHLGTAIEGEFHVGAPGFERLWDERNNGPALVYWANLEDAVDYDQAHAILEELRRRFKALTGRAPWEQ